MVKKSRKKQAMNKRESIFRRWNRKRHKPVRLSMKIKSFLAAYILGVTLLNSAGLNLYSEISNAATYSGKFEIDTENVYPHMDTSYNDGYNPKIHAGKATVVMPLVFDGDDTISGDEITATVQYTSVTDMPFVIKQYQKQVEEDSYNLEDGQSEDVYLVQFDLDLKNDRVNGTYPVNIAIQYRCEDEDAEGNSVYADKEQVFPAYVVIQDGIDPNGEDEKAPTDINIRLDSCTVSPEVIYPGDEFTIRTQLSNTSEETAIKDMKISYDNAEGVLIPVGNTGTKYLDKLEAGKSDVIEFEMKAAGTITNYQQKVVLNIEYKDDEGKSYTDVENIYIAIAPPPDEHAGLPVSNALVMETKHAFSGMDNSYEKGYTPEISKEQVTVVMPVVFKGNEDITGNEITALVGFGDTANQSFQIKSYEKKFKLINHRTKDGTDLPVFLVSFTLDLKKDRINGVYPINITMRYEAGTEVKEQVFTAFVVIEDGKDPNEEEPEEEPPVQFTPKIIIDNCITEPAECKTGDEVTFKVTLKNTSKDKNIKDIKLTYLSETGDLIPVENNNSLFIDSLGIGKHKDITFKMKVQNEITAANQTITLNMEGVDDLAAAVTSADSLFLHINQTVGIKIDNPVLKAEVKSGKTEKIKVPIFNTGRTKVKNIMCVLDMDGVIPSGTAYIGEIEPSATGEATINAVIANRKVTDKSVAEEDKYGVVKGTITVNYEDMDGKTYTQSVEVKTKIVPPEKEVKKAAGIASQWWLSFIIGLIIIQFIIYGILFYRKRRLL